MNDLKVFTGNANKSLAEEICNYLGIPMGDALVTRFSDGEIRVKINENIRGADVFIIQPTFPPADNLLELLIMMDAARRASAWRITAVIPYFGYARQDKKDEPRVPISAKLVSNLLVTAGADRILTMDLHAEQIQGYFDIPVDHLYAAPVIIDYLRGKNLQDVVIVAPDPGRANRARAIAKRFGNVPIAIVDKRRPEPNRSEVIYVVGDVADKTAVIIDDIVDTGGTLVGAAEALVKQGAKEVYACVTHPVLSGPAVERIENSTIKELVVTNTIPLGDKKRDKFTVLSVASLLGEAIRRIHNEESVSSLFI
ncbi:ribose-phosphate pyrophosphokinase [bacterium]|nr:MAG: ribose-phosphate pyrophosphokinase [bacterium]